MRWRLLGGNNRVLGVSARDFADHAAALDDVERIRRSAAQAEFDFEHGDGGQWWWRMSVRDRPVAQSAHGFARRVDAALAADRFGRSVRGADSDLPLAVFQPGRRGREIPLGEPENRPCGGSVPLSARSPLTTRLVTDPRLSDSRQDNDDRGER
ncbi:DUF1508 domain-containing protein [Kutzneria sp. CA-103260]|uniref:DUF1508 domain-containing protein n=1 Tax=Kutzneria sp. CA-103260 TaxID=2802641 RepID=UPI001BAC394D|nr:DUF1508 domain-containing protein [Kutzneria sp. CA-103260]